MEKDRLFKTSLVAYSLDRDLGSVYNRTFIVEVI
jgi:hypothetical protein